MRSEHVCKWIVGWEIRSRNEIAPLIFDPIKGFLRPPLLIKGNLLRVVLVDGLRRIPGDRGDYCRIYPPIPQHRHDHVMPEAVASPPVGVHLELRENLFYGETQAPERSAEKGGLTDGIGLDVFPALCSSTSFSIM